MYALMAGVALHVAHGLFGVDFGLPATVFDDWLYNGVLIASALVCVTRAVLVREERLAWALIGVGLLAWSAADLYYTLVLAKLDAPPYPSISDAGWLIFYPAFWAALVLLIRRRVREFHASLWLDGLVAALGVAACVATLVLPPILAMSLEGELAAVAVNLAYPAGDLLLIALLLGALALTGWRPDRSITLIGIGVLLSGLADLSYLDAVAHGNYDAPAWASSLWPASALVTAIAAWQPMVTVRPMQLEGRRLLVLPVAAMTAALGLLFVDHFHRVHDLGAVLAFATLVVAGVRLWLTLGEHMSMLGTSRDEATTDPLTGWGIAEPWRTTSTSTSSTPRRNARSSCCSSTSTASSRTTTCTATPRATRSWSGSAGRCRDRRGAGHAYRMGGDEFCVLTRRPRISTPASRRARARR